MADPDPQLGVTADRFTDFRVPDPGIKALFTDENKWQKRLDVEAALAAAQAEVGMIPAEAAAAIARKAKLREIDLAAVLHGIAASSHPLMPLVVELSRAVGDEYGGWVHWGATTQNITQTADILIVREAHTALLALVTRILVASGRLAEKTADVPMPGRTHGQHAVPITFGFKVATWVDEFLRHRQRLRRQEPALFVAMAGGAVGNFAAVGDLGPEIQARLAARLDLRPMAVPSRSIVDHLVEYVTTLGLIAGTGAKIAREIFTLMKPEFAEAREPIPRNAIGSSTMPHKRNPQLTQDILTISAQVRALVPLALESMLQDHEVDGSASAMLENAVQSACILTGDLLVRLAVVVEGLELDEDRMAKNLDLTHGLITSEAIMMALAETIGRQQAHDLVHAAAQEAATTGADFYDCLRSDDRIAAHLPGPDFLTPQRHTGLSAQIAREAAQRATAAAYG